MDIVRREADFKALVTEQFTAAVQTGHPNFDADWFGGHCDFSSMHKQPFASAKFQLSGDESADKAKWRSSKKCEESGDTRKPEMRPSKKRYECAQMCMAKADEQKGTVICCEFDTDREMCEIRIGSQALQTSKYGTDMWNPSNWKIAPHSGTGSNWNRSNWKFGRKPKVARLFFSAGDGAADLTKMEAHEEFLKAEEGQEHVKELMTQVNHMSIDGMLDHMLSFYVCVRWVPDTEFLKLLEFETEHVAVNGSTRPHSTSREELIQDYIEFNAVPLRCGDAKHVQDLESINELLASLEDPASDLSTAVRFSERVASAGVPKQGNLLRLWAKLVEATDKAMHYRAPKDGTEAKDSVFVQDMNVAVSANLPWAGYVRPSTGDHHVSSPDNSLLLCFGPRVASFPHKREGGEHFLADMNMAGCNGFWSLESLSKLLENMKKLFAPEMCFEHELRRQLKTQFLRTFVRMNEQFELAITGRFAKNVQELDPTGHAALAVFEERTVDSELPEEEQDRKRMSKKYSRVGNLIAKAHAKWALCPAQEQLRDSAIGAEDNFFRDPAAYEKWIGETDDPTEPECKTLDDATGCVMCAVAVTSVYKCPLRLDVTLKDVVNAIEKRKYPFLQSKYYEHTAVKDEAGHEQVKIVQRQGACMVRKEPMSRDKRYREMAIRLNGNTTMSKEEKVAALANIADHFTQISNDDLVVAVDMDQNGKLARVLGGGEKVVAVRSEKLYTVEQRKQRLAELRELDATGEAAPPVLNPELELALDQLTKQQYTEEDFAQNFVFTEKIAEENNRQEHRVNYFVSCPCDKSDMGPIQHFKTYGSQGMADYYNF